MKKHLLSLLCFVIAFNSQAQYFPFTEISGINYYFSSAKKQMLITDSILYTIKSGGLELLNLANGKVEYKWANHYNLRKVVADTGGHYAYLKDNYDIGRYNASTQQYEIIQADSLQNQNVSDIDISANGNLWIMTDHKLFIYNGINWQPFIYPAFVFANEIKVMSDTLAYLRSYNEFYRFHQGVFEIVFSLPSNLYCQDWDIDEPGSLWIAALDTLMRITNGVVTKYDASNTPLGTDKFLFVNVGSNGHAWTAGSTTKMLEFDGAVWNTYTVPNYYPVKLFALNDQNFPWVIAGYSSIYNQQVYLDRFDGSNWSGILFSLMPFRNNITAMSFDQVGTSEGIFNIGILYPTIYYFNDSNDNALNTDATCFSAAGANNYNYFDEATGTHHGILNLTGFDNSQLPNDTINYIYYDNGSYYIGTNGGMVVFNGLLYSYFNQQNTPLPSDKVTFITSDGYLNALYVGTDKGFTVYQSGQWTTYDSSDMPVPHFYVTGILTHEEANYNDSAIYITTLGSGIIKLFPAGSYELLNTTEENFADDSIYYIIHAFLGKCGSFIFVGTQNHGLGLMSYYYNGSFTFDTSYGRTSKFAAKDQGISNTGGILVATDSGLFYAFPCGGVENQTLLPAFQLHWQQERNNLIVTAPEQFSGEGTCMMMDMLGRTITVRDHIHPGEKIILNEEALSSGTYLLRFQSSQKTASAKLIWNHL